MDFFKEANIQVKKRSHKKSFLWILVAILFASFGLILLFPNGPSQSSKKTQASVHSQNKLHRYSQSLNPNKKDDEVHRKAIELVNKNLQYDQRTIEMRQGSRLLDTEKDMKAFRENPYLEESPLSMKDRELGVEVFVDDGSRDVLKDLNESDLGIYDTDLTPEQVIDLQLQKLDLAFILEAGNKWLFVETFLEEAREKGYEVQLNEQLEVVNVKRIPTDKPYRGGASIIKMYESGGAQ